MLLLKFLFDLLSLLICSTIVTVCTQLAPGIYCKNTRLSHVFINSLNCVYSTILKSAALCMYKVCVFTKLFFIYEREINTCQCNDLRKN